MLTCHPTCFYDVKQAQFEMKVIQAFILPLSKKKKQIKKNCLFTMGLSFALNLLEFVLLYYSYVDD